MARFSDWRSKSLLGDSVAVCVADLGHNVLDSAMVEAASYCVERNQQSANDSFFCSVVHIPAELRGKSLLQQIMSSNHREPVESVYYRGHQEFFFSSDLSIVLCVSARIVRALQIAHSIRERQ